MHELICPNCGKPFRVDEADYASILNQVKGAEFNAEVDRRIEELHKQHEAEELAREAMADQQHQNELFKKDMALADKEREIADLKATINRGKSELEIAVLKEQQKVKDSLQEKEAEIARLKAASELERSKARLEENAIREDYENKLRVAQEQVDYYKDLKTRMSTKMVGETLEAHCSTIFNGEMRPMFPNAYFEKDNDASGGSKGDFIFRDFDGDTEYISIMFEMKNEMDETASKHKNEDFFKKLDADRNAKGCEYAVLVSLLEPDSELYNGGIVDVSYRYPKMYVIRPQFFKSMITLLVNAAKKTVEIKKELAVARIQNVDVTNFEKKIDEFKKNFTNHYTRASGKFTDAIKQIDETIKKLEAVKKSFEQSENYLRLANQDTDGLTIRKLTWGNPTMKAKFEEARQMEKDNDNENTPE